MALKEFIIIPVKGRKVNMVNNYGELLERVSDNVGMTNDVGGINFDVNIKKMSCTKSRGYVQLGDDLP